MSYPLPIDPVVRDTRRHHAEVERIESKPEITRDDVLKEWGDEIVRQAILDGNVDGIFAAYRSGGDTALGSVVRTLINTYADLKAQEMEDGR